ncbi:DUF6111 family protein [Rhodospirillaceae bacterium SYSU D60014]|uniref:DUF6111 family protein n=1 Tax=Virgifigura deserti TaxID=2268457 RepID=UPI000E66849C
MRQFFSIVVPLVLPTVLYFVYMTMARRRAQTASGRSGWWQEVPWTWLGIAGAILMIVTLSAFALFGGAEPGSVYQPAKLIDGEIKPGGFVE